MDIQEEFNEIIKKNLPAQVGEQLQEVLKEAEKNKEKIAGLEKIIDEKDEFIKRIQAQYEDQYKELTDLREIDRNIEKFQKERFEFQITKEVYKERLKSAESQIRNMQTTISTIFSYRADETPKYKTLNLSGSIDMPQINGYHQAPLNFNINGEKDE